MRRSIHFVVGLIVSFFALSFAFSTQAADPTLSARYKPVSGHLNDVAVVGNFAYLGVDRGLLIVDVSSSNNPKLVGIYQAGSTGLWVNRVQVVGTTAYVIFRAGGSHPENSVHIIDVSEPSKPTLKSKIAITPADLVVSDNYLYAIFGTTTLSVYDVSNSSNPTLTFSSSVLPQPSTHIGTAEQYLYVTGAFATSTAQVEHHLFVLERTSRGRSVVLRGSTSFTLPGLMGIHELSVDGSTVFLTAGRYVEIFDVSTPTAPARIKEYTIVNEASAEHNAYEVVVKDKKAFIAGNSRLRVLNVSSLADPTLVVDVTVKTATHLVIVGNYLYLSQGRFGLVIFDISDPTNPQRVGQFKTHFPFKDIYMTRATSPFALAVDSVMGMWVIDTSADGGPTALTFYDTPGTPQRVVKHNAQAYIADKEGGLVILDIDKSIPAGSEPPPVETPKLLARYTKAKLVWDVDLWGRYAFLAVGTQGVWVLDISDPSKPKRVGVYPTANDLRYIEVSGDSAYVAGNRGAIITLDVSDPKKPKRTSVISYRSGRLTATGRLFSGALTKGLNIFSLQNPKRPRLLGNADTKGTAWSVTMGGTKRAYVADGKQGVAIFDVSKPSKPTQLVTYKVKGGDVRAIAKPFNSLLLAAGTAGIVILDVTGI